jgi:hypothetical protein
MTTNPWGNNTANKFGELCAIRGVVADVEWRDRENSYYINGEKMGQSIQGCFDWLEAKVGTSPKGTRLERVG